MDPTATPNKPSGIPRPSRLPILRNRSSQIFTKPIELPVGPPKSVTSTPRLQKRSSAALVPRSTPSGLKDAAAATTAPTSRALNPNGTQHASKSSSSTRAGAVRPSSRGNQQRQLAATSKPTKPDDEENNDQLGSLDGFRAASRQGFHDDSPIEYQEPAQPDDEYFRPRDRTKSRPSLSDRAIESLQALPSTPSDRRRSSFFSPVESPMGPPPRPTSALSRNGSSHSRPGTSDGTFAKPVMRPVSPVKKVPASAKPSSRIAAGGFGIAPSSAKRRSVSTAFMTKLQTGTEAVLPIPRSPSPAKQSAPSVLPNGVKPRKPMSGSKTFSARASKPRPALGDAFAPRTEKVVPGTAARNPGSVQKAQPASKRVTSNPGVASSSALREQIAAAKAAARKEKAKHDSPQQADVATFGASDNDMHADPFNLAPKDGKHILRNRIKAAWTDGKLNIAAMSLKRIPDEVIHMYDASAMEEGKVHWAEVVDLTKLIAADNEFEELGEDIFPDKSAEELTVDDESQGNQFGGLELLDLHNNTLQALPIGLRRLERLTSLNLAHNKLDNSCLDIASQIASLKELRLGHNNLSGNPSAALCNLPHLETLDLQANRLLGLPAALRDLVSLRVLNISGNQLTALPMEALQQLPLSELDASSNALIGSLFPLGGASAHPTLRTLNVANNSLAALTFSEALDLPQLRTLIVTNNHLTVLPPVSGWTELATLTAVDNKIADFPVGFTGLGKLRNVNFTSNELRVLDPEIARMGSLESLILAANPLREKKYLTMRAEDIKRDLRAKLEPADPVMDGELSDPETVIGPSSDGVTTMGTGSTRSLWKLKPNGTLDLASKQLSDDINDSLGSFLTNHEVLHLQLQANNLTAVPPALWLGQDLRTLDLSGNALASEYFCAELALPALRELNLSGCRLTSLEPLLTQLAAPSLQTLDLTANRLTGAVPALRVTYTSLVTLRAGDNKFGSVTAEALRGLHTVNLAGNSLEALPAELGGLWEEGLRHLEVGSNAFRVPGYRVLEKGTEGVLRWLRGRMPAAAGEGAGDGGRGGFE